jgi:hypothetical protein
MVHVAKVRKEEGIEAVDFTTDSEKQLYLSKYKQSPPLL